MFVEIENFFKDFRGMVKHPNFTFFLSNKLTLEGGLQFPNIRKIDMALKASWLKRIFKWDDGLVAFPKMFKLELIYIYCDVYLEKL